MWVALLTPDSAEATSLRTDVGLGQQGFLDTMVAGGLSTTTYRVMLCDDKALAACLSSEHLQTMRVYKRDAPIRWLRELTTAGGAWGHSMSWEQLLGSDEALKFVEDITNFRLVHVCTLAREVHSTSKVSCRRVSCRRRWPPQVDSKGTSSGR